MAEETKKKVNTIKSIGKKVANNGDANDYVYVPIGADSDNVDRPDGSTVEGSLSAIESDKVEFIAVEALPETDIEVYPFVYALVKPNESKGVLYEYRNDRWIPYGSNAKNIWVGTKEECAEDYNNIEIGTIVIIVNKNNDSEDTHTHDYIEFLTKPPTYSETGMKTCKCFLCGDSYTEEIPALIDSVNPAGVIRIGSNEYVTWKDSISFDTYYRDNQTVSIEANDNETGVKEIAYHLANTAVSNANIESVAWTIYTDAFEIAPNNNYIVYVRITDNADNVTYICSDGIVMDDVPPVFEGLEDGGTYPTGTVLTVEDGATLTVDGVAVDLVNNTYTFTEPKDTSQLSLTDRAGNMSSITIYVTEKYDPYNIAPADEYEKWYRSINNDNKTIYLTKYRGSVPVAIYDEVIVYDNYIINGEIYRTKIGGDLQNLFYGNSNIQKVIFGNNIDTSDVTSVDSMFAHCSRLESVDFGENFNITKVTSLASMFKNCSSLTSLNLSAFDTSNVKSVQYMFYNCWFLKTLDLRNFDNSCFNDYRYIFAGCRKLTAIYVSTDKWIETEYWNNDMTDDSVFSDCGVTELTYV